MSESKVVERMKVLAVGGASFMMVRVMSSLPTVMDLVEPNRKEEDCRVEGALEEAREDRKGMVEDGEGGRAEFVSAGAM